MVRSLCGKGWNIQNVKRKSHAVDYHLGQINSYGSKSLFDLFSIRKLYLKLFLAMQFL